MEPATPPKPDPAEDEVPPEIDAIHPLVALFFEALESGDRERYTVTPEVLEEVRQTLLGLEASAALHALVLQFARLAIMLRTQFSSPTASRQLEHVLRDKGLRRHLKSAPLTDPRRHELGERYERFVDSEKPTAPAVDAAKPKEAFSLGELGFPKRM